MKGVRPLLFAGVLVLFTIHGALTPGETREAAQLTYAPQVPPPITRTEPAIVEVHLDASWLAGETDVAHRAGPATSRVE
jgi:hypothetical protein